MRNLVLRTMAAALALSLPMIPVQSRAASQNECAIWICLPGGFPQGCAAAYAAMISRVTHFEAPLPDFASCAVGGGGASGMSFRWGTAALVPAHQICSSWSRISHDNETCAGQSTVPAHYVRGTKCVHYHNRDGGEWMPLGCTGSYYWVDVYGGGQMMGAPYYFPM